LTLLPFALKVDFMLLITGASGLLGWNLCRYLQMQGYSVVGTYRRNHPQIAGVELQPLDLEEERSIERIAGAANWQAVIHSAAMTHPDLCEQSPRQAAAINLEGTRRLVECLPAGARLIYISTDLVFDGVKGNYSEEDAPHPPNTYARTKAGAEEVVLDRPGSVVVRPALMYGPGSPFSGGFLSWMAERFQKREPLPLFSDQYRTPVYVGDLARALHLLLQRQPRRRLYHLGGSERLSRVDFGEAYAEVFGVDRRLISPVSFDQSQFVARGKDCSLDSSRFSEEMEFRFSSVREGLMQLREG
jgi:dTDP-4-dehydrorhamnose reductase